MGAAASGFGDVRLSKPSGLLQQQHSSKGYAMDNHVAIKIGELHKFKEVHKVIKPKLDECTMIDRVASSCSLEFAISAVKAGVIVACCKTYCSRFHYSIFRICCMTRRQNFRVRVFLSTRRAWCGDCIASSGSYEESRCWS